MIKQFLQSAGRRLRSAARIGKQKSLAFLPGRFRQKTDKQVKLQPEVSVPTVIAGAVVATVTPNDATVSAGPVKSRKKAQWHLDRYVVEPVEGKVRFHDIGIPIAVMHGIADLGFQYCTPIQAKSLPHLLKGRDIIGRANTGTGKTAVFLITILAKLLGEGRRESAGNKDSARAIKALIIAPTRELVMQIAKDGQDIGKYCHPRIAAIYGGADYGGQMALLKENKCDIIVATPGRLLDFLGKNFAQLGKCSTLIIDEADRMLDMGFIPDVRRIIHRLPDRSERQTLLFSATVTDDVKRLASQWCNQPVNIEIEEEQVSVDTIEQKVYLVTTSEKYTVLYNLLQKNAESRILVFTNQKNEARKLHDRLQRNGIACALLSGDVPQKQRVGRLENFRAGGVKVLVATDVAGRGIHIEDITHVVNYTLPYEPEDYVHRIGRTGRAGAAGISISFACEEGAFYLPEIEKFIGRKLECVVPEEELLAAPPKGSAPPRETNGHHKPRGPLKNPRRQQPRRNVR